MAKVSITLNEQELRELDRIILDQDEKEGLNFLEQLKSKIKATKTRSCGITAQEGG